MSSWDDVGLIAQSLPEVQEGSQRGHRAWKVCDKSFVWERPLRPRDLEELGAAAPTGAIACVRVPDLLAKELLIEHESPSVFATAHFDGYAMVLVELESVAPDLLTQLIEDSWHVSAPKRLSEP